MFIIVKPRSDLKLFEDVWAEVTTANFNFPIGNLRRMLKVDIFKNYFSFLDAMLVTRNHHVTLLRDLNVADFDCNSDFPFSHRYSELK
jgi:hypothetical protein